MLNSGPCDLLLVNDVHQLDGICPLHVHHRPLERIFQALVQLEETKQSSAPSRDVCSFGQEQAGERVTLPTPPCWGPAGFPASAHTWSMASGFSDTSKMTAVAPLCTARLACKKWADVHQSGFPLTQQRLPKRQQPPP